MGGHNIGMHMKMKGSPGGRGTNDPIIEASEREVVNGDEPRSLMTQSIRTHSEGRTRRPTLQRLHGCHVEWL